MGMFPKKEKNEEKRSAGRPRLPDKEMQQERGQREKEMDQFGDDEFVDEDEIAENDDEELIAPQKKKVLEERRNILHNEKSTDNASKALAFIQDHGLHMNDAFLQDLSRIIERDNRIRILKHDLIALGVIRGDMRGDD